MTSFGLAFARKANSSLQLDRIGIEAGQLCGGGSERETAAVDRIQPPEHHPVVISIVVALRPAAFDCQSWDRHVGNPGLQLIATATDLTRSLTT
ncbi:hypothetical protein CRI77_11575 [Mycolicibacterium duvalii]|nr:hypothetical protein CRI77_11575 [Mycolicibacterium duvalii]